MIDPVPPVDSVPTIDPVPSVDPVPPVDTDPAPPATSLPTGSDADLDGDGQSDYAETACGSAPDDATSLSPDDDLDGLPNCLRGYPVLPVIGEPGRAVDCARTLPCTWRSADGAVEAELTLADGYEFGATNGLGVGADLATVIKVTSNRDTTLTFLPGAEARSEGGTGYDGRTRETPLNGPFGSSTRSGREVQVFAGTPIRVREGFGTELDAETSLTELSLPFAELDTRMAAEFLAVPLGRAPSRNPDCGNALPCTWISADGHHRFTIDEAKVNLSDELEIGFSFTTVRQAQRLVMDEDDSEARGDDFEVYDFERFVFGDDSGLYTVTSPTPAGETVTGTMTTIRQAARDSITLQSLNRVRVRLYDDSESLPFLDPIFRNVPVAR